MIFSRDHIAQAVQRCQDLDVARDREAAIDAVAQTFHLSREDVLQALEVETEQEPA